MRSLLILTCISPLLIACGSSGKNTNDGTSDPAITNDSSTADTGDSKFEGQRADTVSKMCERLVDYSIAGAKENQSAEDYEKSSDPKIVERAKAECRSKYTTLSPRQVIGIRECLGVASDATVFGDCLESAAAGE